MANSFLPFHMRVTLVWLLSYLQSVWSCSLLAAGRKWIYLWQELSYSPRGKVGMHSHTPCICWAPSPFFLQLLLEQRVPERDDCIALQPFFLCRGPGSRTYRQLLNQVIATKGLCGQS